MPDTNYLLSESEQERLFRFILDQDCVFVPGVRYKKGIYRETDSLSEVTRLAASDELSGPLFVISKAFSKHPLEMHSFVWNWDGQSYYSLIQRHGGPYIDVFPGKIRRDCDPHRLISGSIGYYPCYYLRPDYVEIETPAEMVDLYKTLKKRLRKDCETKKTESPRSVYYVGPEALQLIRSGVETNAPGLDVS